MPHPILSFLLQIPEGKVVTYKALATRFGIHPRAVAGVLSRNLEPDVFPCYKVVHADGRIGGYNLGIEEKIRRLEKNGVTLQNNKIEASCIWEDLIVK